MMTDEIKLELEAMLESDQRHRQRFVELANLLGSDSPEVLALEAEQSRLDAVNLDRLLEIVLAHGWPRSSEVGDRAALGAFLVLQHADLEIQQHLFPKFQEAVSTGDAQPGHLAMLQDRILVYTDSPQRYGTQIFRNPETGACSFYPIEDEDDVDRRRAEVGLGPIADYAAHFGFEYVPPDDRDKLRKLILNNLAD